MASVPDKEHIYAYLAPKSHILPSNPLNWFCQSPALSLDSLSAPHAFSPPLYLRRNGVSFLGLIATLCPSLPPLYLLPIFSWFLILFQFLPLYSTLP